MVSTPTHQPVAVFDLDGTLIRGDSLLPFLLSYGWRRRRWRALVGLGWDLLLYACRLVSARTAKERLLRRFLRGEPLSAIDAHARSFCDDWLVRHLDPLGLGSLREHQRTGCRVILLSASPSLYVPLAARALGIDEVICTRVRSDGTVCTGEIEGPNCKGTAKLEMLQEYLGAEAAPPESYAYADSSSDLPVLSWVRHGFLLRKGKLTRVAASASSPDHMGDQEHG